MVTPYAVALHSYAIDGRHYPKMISATDSEPNYPEMIKARPAETRGEGDFLIITCGAAGVRGLQGAGRAGGCRVRRLPLPVAEQRFRHHLPREYPHKSPNYCVQGTARELLVDALLAWDQTRWSGSVVLPVHDEIVAVVPEQDAQEATVELVRCMTRELYGIQIVAEASEPAFAWRDSA